MARYQRRTTLVTCPTCQHKYEYDTPATTAHTVLRCDPCRRKWDVEIGGMGAYVHVRDFTGRIADHYTHPARVSDLEVYH